MRTEARRQHHRDRADDAAQVRAGAHRQHGSHRANDVGQLRDGRAGSIAAIEPMTPPRRRGLDWWRERNYTHLPSLFFLTVMQAYDYKQFSVFLSVHLCSHLLSVKVCNGQGQTMMPEWGRALRRR